MHLDRLTHVFKNNPDDKGRYILYWMQQSQRVKYNHALAHAIKLANQFNLPLMVVFVVTEHFLSANERHYTFMFEGLVEVKRGVEEQGATFVIKIGQFSDVIPKLASEAHSVVFDYGYLKPQLNWRREVLDKIVAANLKTNIDLVESDLIVPIRRAYNKVAYGAYVIRPHLQKLAPQYRDFIDSGKLKNISLISVKSDVNIDDLSFIQSLNIDHSVKKSNYFTGGYSHAKKHLQTFIDTKLSFYPQRSDPSLGVQSYLSLYLQFGQISSLEVLDIIESLNLDIEVKKEFVEQLLVRRELAYNYVFYNKNYDNFLYMTEPWAYETMKTHQHDQREFIYTKEEIENGETEDIYFNSAMMEMKKTGFMANYMRMYWAKQIITWLQSYEEAYDLIVELNNKYFIDGRNPNSYVNIAWCFGKMDRPWPERSVWGKLRSMNDKGLKKKFNIDEYVKQIQNLK